MTDNERKALKEKQDKSGLDPDIRLLIQGDWFKNAERTSDERAAVGSSWKDYWQIFTLQDFPTKCPFCGETLKEKDIDGCHIKVWNPTTRRWRFKKLIIPGHHKCNMQLDAEFQTKINILAVESVEKD